MTTEQNTRGEMYVPHITPTEALLKTESAAQVTVVGVILALFFVAVSGYARRFWAKSMKETDSYDKGRDILEVIIKERDEQRLRADLFAKERMDAVAKVATLAQEVIQLRNQIDSQTELVTRQADTIRAMDTTLDALRQKMALCDSEFHRMHGELLKLMRELVDERSKCVNCAVNRRVNFDRGSDNEKSGA